ncbi:MAG: hypothetical protein E7077_14450 [Bacteroidales bacterium]|jgi:type I restriction enzyme S subunit|nr:hypothetical protein [Bacteroidales bacterium]
MKHNWEYKKLGEIGKIITGNTPNTKDAKNYETNEICFVKPSDISGEGINYISNSEFHISKYAYENSRQLPKGSILTTCIGNIGKVAILEIEATCNQQINAIIPNKDIDSKFLAYSIISQRYLLQSMANAPVVPILNKTQFSNFSISIPPLPTQQAIVSELDTLSGIIAECKETLKDYDALEQSIFYDMFGDPVKNEKGWEVKKLEDICSNIVDCPHSTPTKSDVPTIYPCIRTSELRNGEIYWDSMQYVEEEEYKNRIVRLQPQKDDIVFGREGSIGGAVILPEGYQFCLGQRTMLLRVDESIIHSIFLHRVILSDWVKNQIMDKNVASTVAHVNVKDVKAFLIPIPPLPLQQDFATKIEAIEQMKAETREALQEAETLFQARMDYWFN